MKIENVNKEIAVMLSNELMAAAEAIAEKYGMSVKRGSGKYDSQEYKLNSVTFFVPSQNTNSQSGRYTPSQENKMVVNWNMRRGQHGMEDIEVGHEYFNRDGCKMKLVGFDTKKRKYPVIVENLTKKGSYKMSMNSFRVALLDG